MATILMFKTAERMPPPPMPPARVAYRPPCEIILFPGVRYEYHAAAKLAAPKKQKRKSPRKRDKLILKD